MFRIAKLKLSNARKYKKFDIPLSADLAAICAILIGPPKAFLNSTSPVKTFPIIEKVNAVIFSISFQP